MNRKTPFLPILAAAALAGGCQHGADHHHDAHAAHAASQPHDAHAAHAASQPHDTHAAHAATKHDAHATSQPHDTHAAHDAHDAHAAHAASQPHAAHAAGGAHDLKPLMRRMLMHVVALQDALTGDRAGEAARHATALAEACEGGEEHAHHDLPADWGPSFVEIDRTLHQGAKKLKHVLHEGDLGRAKQMYSGLVGQCQACHAQAPVAAEVRLGRLLEAPE